MSDAGLPGMGLKLGAELLRSPNGIWFSATAADGRTLGVLRFDPERLKPAGAVDRLIERVVAARAGMLPGVLPVVDLVEDAGRIWLITSAVPVAETAGRTETLLLSPPSPGSQAQQMSAVPVGGGQNGAGVWRPSVELSEQYQAAGQAEWSPRDLRDSRTSRGIRLLIGLLLVAGVMGAAVAGGLALRSKGNKTALLISGINVQSNTAVTKTTICNAKLDMVAVLQTNSGTGEVAYEWDLPGTKPVIGKQTVAGKSAEIHLDWRLRLKGTDKVTAVFKVTNPGVLASGVDPTASASFEYQCP